ncbi:MAG: hypothetical protein PSV24_11080 [Rhodoferax sp.]|nr:hypothetical protein [Rhodoferax sp.]
MSETFAATTDVTRAFVFGVSAGALTVCLMAGVVLAGLWDAQRQLYLKSVAAFALLAVGSVACVTYFVTFGRFVAARTTGSMLELRYAGPLARSVLIERGEIDAVLFGTTGKSARPCYIKVILKSRESYRSATLDAEVATCKRIRSEMVEGSGR